MKHDFFFEEPSERTARQVRDARMATRRSQPLDPLLERERLVKFWRRCLITNKGYCEPQSRALYRNIGFWRYLMPKTQALLLSRAQESRRVYADHLRIQSQEWERKKALRKAKPMTLFQEAA